MRRIFFMFLGLLAVMGMPAVVFADVVVVGTGSGSNNDNNSEFTFSVNVPAGAELAVVGVSNRDGRNVSWVRFDGQSDMTYVLRSTTHPRPDMDERAELYYFVNPPAGNQTVRVRLSGDTRHKAAGCLLLTGVNTAALASTAKKADENYANDNPTPTLTFTGAEAPSGSLVVSVIGSRGNELSVHGGSQTQRWNIETSHWTDTVRARHGGGTAAGSSASGVSVSWSPSAGWPTNPNWGMVAMVIPASYYGITAIEPDAFSVDDNAPNNAVIGTLTATDGDNKPPYTWSLIDSAGGRFALNASNGLEVEVRIANASLIDFGQDESHVIRVGARNAEHPVVFEKDVVVSVVDKTHPVISPVTASRTYARWGEFVTFSAPVTDNAELADTPVMTLAGVPLVFSHQSGDVFTWGWNVPLAQGDGWVDVVVTAEDVAGNVTVREEDQVLIIDNTPPVISDLTVSHAHAKVGDIVEIGVDILDFYGVVDFPAVTFAGVDGGFPTVSGFRYTWQIGITESFPEGPADVLVSAYDVAGNLVEGSGPAMTIIDRTLPSIMNITSSRAFGRLNDVVVLEAIVFDANGLSGMPKMYVHGNLLDAPTVSGNTYRWHLTITSSVQQGNAVIVVDATDMAGNNATASPPTTILVVDYTVPNISQLTVSPARAKGGTSLVISARVLDNYGLSGTPALAINGWPASAPSQSGYIYTWNFIVPSTPPPTEGPAEITILATDLAGNVNNLLDASKLTYDPNGPVFSAVVATPALVRSGQTSSISVNVYDISPLDGLPTLHVNGTPAVHAGSVDAGAHNRVHTFTYTVGAATPEGDAALSFWGRDILGNERTTGFTGKLLVDKTAPVISNLSVSPSVSREGGVVNITFDAADALTEVFGTPTVTVNGASAVFYNRSGDHYTFRYTVRSEALDPNGPLTVFVSCRDTVGNSGFVENPGLLIIDNSAPVISNLTVFPSYAREGDRVVIGFSAFDDSGLGFLPEVKVNDAPASFVKAQQTYFEYAYTIRAAHDDEGYARLYIRVVDGVGNAAVSQSTGLLIVDFSPPTGTLLINGGDVFTRIQDVTLSITATDGALGSGVASMSFSDDGLSWTPWEALAASRQWQLKAGQGYKTIYMRLRDYTGNETTMPISDTIALNPHRLIVEREGSGDVKGMLGYATVLEVTPRNVFGSVQSYEWSKDGKILGGAGEDKFSGPVLAIDSLHYSDEGVYVCTVSDELETAQSPPFQVTISETVPAGRWVMLSFLALVVVGAGAWMLRRSGGLARALCVVLALSIGIAGAASAEVTVVYSARAESPMDLSDEALVELAYEHGAVELWTRAKDGTVKRQLSRMGEPGVANPGFSSHHREEFQSYLDKGAKLNVDKDGNEVLAIALSDEAVLVYGQNDKSIDGPTFEMKVFVNDAVVLSEKRYEEFVDGHMRPVMLRVDYPGGAMIQVFEFTDDPPPPLPPVYLRKVGVDDDEKSDTYPKSWATKDEGDAQTREVQFIVPPQGLGAMGFDSGWVPGGSGPDPGGFIIQVRINATAGYTYDAAVNGAFNLSLEDLLGLGPAAGSWGFYFGAQFYMKAAFDIPPLFGFKIDPFTVDIPYVPDFNMVTSDRDEFNSWLLEEVSTVRDEGGRTQVTSVDLVALLITQGVLPELPSWVPLPKIGAALDIGAIANGRLTCDNIALTDGTVFTLEGQELPIYVPQSGYQAIAAYNEDAELNLGVKFYPYVFVSWFSFGFRWPTDFEDSDNLLARLEWLPVSHKSFPFSNAEINFTGQPSTQPANDWFTQHFQPVIDTNNVSHKQVRFTPNLSNNFYTACVGSASAYRTNPAGGTTVTLGNDAFVEVVLTDNKEVTLYGNRYSSFFIGSNGYITFNQGDTAKDPSLEAHFNQPRISGLFLDLKPNESGTISYKQLPNRVVVTYHAVRLAHIITEQTANFQIEMFFDGRIVITWLQLDTYVGLVGLSRGGGVPEGYQKSRFVNYPGCLTGIAEEYGVRVNFSPPEVLPYEPRWRVASGEWQRSGTYISRPLGTSWVYFNYIPIYWHAPETAMAHTATPDTFVNLNPVWTRAKGTVNVNTQPDTASWVLTDADGVQHTGVGPASLTGVPTGMLTIQWQPLATYSLPTPASQQVMLYPDATISFNGSYPPIIGEGQATLIVTLEPALAIAAGAQWRVNGGAWLDSGVPAIIPDGDSTMEFKELSGWTKPASQTLFFHRNTTTTLSKGYGRHRGSVLIETDPPGAPWTLVDGDGVVRTGFGYTGLQNVPVGDDLAITWGEVASYTPPVPNPTVFALAQGQAKRVIGAYTPIIGDGEGIVRVTLLPAAVVNAGAQWRLFGGDWRSSGGMTASPDGERTIIFRDLPGWITPEDQEVVVVRDEINDYYGTYTRLTGTVHVDVTPDTAFWTLTDEDGGVHAMMGDAEIENVPAGELSILWGDMEGYAPPQPNPSVYTLEADGLLHIVGDYVEALVTADFSAYPLIGTPPLEVNFQDLSHSTTKDIVEWRWYFGDGRTSTERNPRHLYRDVGTYTVTLTVTTYDQMDVTSRKHYITVTDGVPAAGLPGLVLLVLAVSSGGAMVVSRRQRR